MSRAQPKSYVCMRKPEAQNRIKAAMKPGFQAREAEMILPRMLDDLASLEQRGTWVNAREKHDKAKFEKEITALLLIDPYNDFISEGGKLWDRIKNVAEANDCIAHMLQLLTAARTAGIRVFYAMHHRYRPGDYETWKYTAPIQKAAWSRKTFEYGTWGGEFRAEFAPQPGDIVAHEHWCSSGFANTDLDLQLKRHGIQRLIVAGLDRAHMRRIDRTAGR